MLVLLSEYLVQFDSGFNVFGYVTLRTILAVLTALLFALAAGPFMIRRLAYHQIGQPVRDDGPESHYPKAGTPTMGGALVLVAVAVSALLWADPRNAYVWIALATMLGFGMIGCADDYRKQIVGDSRGVRPLTKYLGQSVLGVAAAVVLYILADTPVETALIVPFFKDVAIELGVAYVVFVYFVIVGSSNAVNLTDGLDGLAVVPTALIAGALAVFAYVSGHSGFAEYLGIPSIAGAGEVAVFCGAMVGAGLGFLWFNTYPAQIFLGDVGALGLGAALGVVAVMVRQELVLLIMGGVFVAETVSVILQVAHFKRTGRRIFHMAPLHHHFELKGWPEPRVSVRFWIVTVVLVLVGLATLKIR